MKITKKYMREMKKDEHLSVRDYQNLKTKVRDHVSMYIPVPQDVDEKTQEILLEIVSNYNADEVIKINFDEEIRRMSYTVCMDYLNSKTVSNNFPLHSIYEPDVLS